MNRIKSSDIQLGNSYILDNTESKPRKSSKEIKAVVNPDEIIGKAKAEAAKILEQAQQQAQEILEKSESSVKQAQEEGYQAGYQDGQKKIQEDLINQIKSVDIIANSTFKLKREIILSSEQEILQLTTTIAEKIIKRKLEIEPEICLNIIKSAICELKNREEINIIVNPTLTKYLYEFSEELKQTINGLKTVKIMEDRSIPMDGIMIESPEFRIDARIETQIAEIVKKFIIESEENPVIGEIVEEIITDDKP